MSYERLLNELQDVLQRADIIRNWGPTTVYRLSDGSTRISFVARIAIRPDAHAKPAGVDFSDADIEFELEIADGHGLDRVRRCSAQVIIEGTDANGELYKFALHFDRHDPAESSIDLHAHYHWQIGGDKLEACNFGTVLQLQSPRFPWHPLDPVLLIDFVLGQFHGGKRVELMTNPAYVRYRRILYISQSSLVEPFFTLIHEALTAQLFTGTTYWPSLCGKG